jgi:formiminotetrahydrofolate cyclodeaminase
VSTLHADWPTAAQTLAAALATTDSTPGGGAAAGVAGQMGCALAQMSVGISARSKKIEAARRAALEAALTDFAQRREDFARLTTEDAKVFDAVMAVYALAKDDPERPARMQTALQAAADVPLQTAQAAVAGIACVRDNQQWTVGTVTSDMNCAAHLLRAAGLSALENVEINASCMKDSTAAGKLRERLAAVRAQLAA